MTAARLRDFILKGLLFILPVVYLPWAEDPFRHFRENIFQLGAVALLIIFLNERLFGEAEGKAKASALPEEDAALLRLAGGAFVLSLFINGLTPLGMTTAVNFILGVAVYAAFRAAIAPEDAGKWMAVFMAPALLNAVFALAQYAGWNPLFQSLDPQYHNLYRRYLVAGFLDSPNLLAPFVASFAPWFFARFMAAETSGQSAQWGAALVLAIAPVGLSQNLAAAAPLAAVLGAMLVYFTVRFIRQAGPARVKTAAGWIAAALIALAAIQGAAARDADSRLIKQWSVDERTDQNEACFIMFSQAPAFGKGPGFFYSHFMEYRRAVWFSRPPLRLPERPALQAHNDYLQLLAEGGLLTLLPLAALAALWLYHQGRFFLRRIGKPPLPMEPHLMGAAGGFWIIALNAMGCFPFHIAPLAMAAAFWGAAASVMLKYLPDEN